MRNRRNPFLIGATLATQAVAASASADPITIVTSRQRVTVTSNSYDGSLIDRQHLLIENQDTLVANIASAAGDSRGQASASLGSQVGPSSWSGTGRATATHVVNGGSGDAHGSAGLVIEFTLSTPHAYDLAATFTGTGLTIDEDFLASRGTTSIFLSRVGESLFRYDPLDTGTLARAGFLAPGRYIFGVQASAAGQNPFAATTVLGGTSMFDFTFRLTESSDPLPAPTPEPASLLLIASGLGGVLARRRRRSTT